MGIDIKTSISIPSLFNYYCPILTNSRITVQFSENDRLFPIMEGLSDIAVIRRLVCH